MRGSMRRETVGGSDKKKRPATISQGIPIAREETPTKGVAVSSEQLQWHHSCYGGPPTTPVPRG